MTILALLLSATSLFAQSMAEKSEVVVYYRHDKHSIDHRYLSNPEAFTTLDSIFLHHADAIDSISIVAYASPEGRSTYNQWLSGKRAESMKRFLRVKYPEVDFSNLATYAKGEDFEGLVRMVEADKKVPHRKEVLRILNNKKLHVDNRMKQLYALRGGYPYAYIRKNILPYLRTATTCIIYYNPAALAEQEVLSQVAEEPLRLESIGGGSMLLSLSIADFVPTPYKNIYTEESEERTYVEESGATEESVTPTTTPTTPAVEEQTEVKNLVALKTNLLFDAIAAVNVGVEIPFGTRYSLDASWTFPWYLPKSWDWCYQLLWGDVEGRYWLGERTRDNRLKGHFVGLYAGAGLYDFQWRSTDGYQGEFFIAAGLSYGYAMELAKSRCRLEFEIGLGYLQSNYRHYFHITDPEGNETLIRDKVSGRFGYWGPTKAKVSLVVPIEWGGKKR